MPGTSLTAYIISFNSLNNAVVDILTLQMKKLKLRTDNVARGTTWPRSEHSPVYPKPTLYTVAPAASWHSLTVHISLCQQNSGYYSPLNSVKLSVQSVKNVPNICFMQ